MRKEGETERMKEGEPKGEQRNYQANKEQGEREDFHNISSDEFAFSFFALSSIDIQRGGDKRAKKGGGRR